MLKQIIAATTISAAALVVSTAAGRADTSGAGIGHVLLISIDGMHAIDFINCASNSTCPAVPGAGGIIPKLGVASPENASPRTDEAQDTDVTYD